VIVFSPSGSLNVAHDPSELPEQSDGKNISSGAMVRCKNLRLDQKGIAKTRDGSAKLNSVAIDTPVWWIEVQDGTRYAFAGESIYENETEIEDGLTSAQWAAIQYNAFNESSENIFALNGTDRKRIEGGAVYEWGIAAPDTAPTVSVGQGTGLTGQYKARYTYVRKSGDTVIAESDPSPESEIIELNNQSLSVEIEQPTDPQVTHIRLYRTSADGLTYNHDYDIVANLNWGYGYCFDWEADNAAFDTSTIAAYSYGYTFFWETSEISGSGYKWSTSDGQFETTYPWEGDYSVDWDASVSDDSVIGAGAFSTIATDTVTVTVTNPISPTYAWSRVSGDNIAAMSPTSASTAFVASGMASGETRTATFQCVVTDSPFSETLEVDVTIVRLPI
jgi:hypothetical protein